MCMGALQFGNALSYRLESTNPNMLQAKWQNLDDEFDEDMQQYYEKERDKSVSSAGSPLSDISDRIKNGNYLDVLAISVTLFFLATAWLSGGRLFNDFTSVKGRVQFTKSLMRRRYCKKIMTDILLTSSFRSSINQNH